MKKNIESKEKGQIIVILAIALVAILGLTALAIDGSRTYDQRRTDQSTADSAALAGAGAAAQKLKNSAPSSFYCGSSLAGQASNAAVQKAQASALADNKDLEGYNLSNGNGVDITCGTNGFATYLDIHVVVTSEVNTTFGKIVGINTTGTKVEAIARVYPKQPAAYGNAIVSLSDDCGGISFGGNSTIKINKGGVFSNSCLGAGGSTNVTIIGGTATYYSTFSGSCSNSTADPCPSSICPCPNSTTTKLPDLNFNLPTCPAVSSGAYTQTASTGTISPGNYDSLDVPNKGTLTLQPGLYCVKGSFGANAKAVIHADNVTMVFMTDGVHFNGQAELHFSAPNCETMACGVNPNGTGAIRGLLFYLPPENTNADFTLNGGSDNDYMGTIYGPKTIFKINGGSLSDTFNTQLIGYHVNFIGNSNMYMNLEGAELYQQPASIDLLK